MIDYHVHLWPHPERADEGELAVERVAAYCERAAAAGVAEIALTEHFFRFRGARKVVEGWWEGFGEAGPMRQYVVEYFDHHATADLDRYFATIEAAKQAGLPVVAGLEVDYYPGRMDEVAAFLAGYPWDVLLGSIHWMGLWLFDILDDALQMDEWGRRDVSQAWREYARAIEELAGSGSVDVLAHPDLIKIARRYPASSLVAECEERIAEAAAESGLAAELSSAGKRACGEDYPSPSLLGAFAARGVPLTLASDSHGSSKVGERNGELLAAARAAGYDSLRLYRGRQPLERSLPPAGERAAP